jgi:hypothetical protein
MSTVNTPHQNTASTAPEDLPEEPLLTGHPHPKPENGFWSRLNWQVDNWAAKYLTRSEFDRAKAAEADFFKHWLRYLLIYLAFTTLLAWALRATLNDTKMTIGPSLIVVHSGAFGLLCSFVGYLSASPRLNNHMNGWPWGGRLKGGYAIAAGFATGITFALLGMTVGNLSAGRPPFQTIEKILTTPRLMGTVTLVLLIAILFVLAINFITKQRQESLRRIAQLERVARRATEADLKLLQAQVEPHFLYNTLANLRYLVQSNSPKALAMTDHVIEYLRQSLPNFRSETTSVAKDIELARSYLSIMEIRMGGTMTFSASSTADASGYEVSPLMLLTLVENAVKHGVGRSIDGGQIDVEAFVDEDLLVLQVRDTGAGLQAKTSETLAKPATGGVGLANIRERIQSLYGDEASLTLSANQPRGAVSTLSIPIAKLKKSI